MFYPLYVITVDRFNMLLAPSAGSLLSMGVLSTTYPIFEVNTYEGTELDCNPEYNHIFALVDKFLDLNVIY